MNIYRQIKVLALQNGKNLTIEQIKAIYTSFQVLPEKTNTSLLNLIQQA